ncbi:MAG: 2-C-methyl-D-erythritol 2,4-cyclodiphosphate synthase [Planctomycetota bacterium]|jgi:2-C-methyl-D-erythritol 2,4-cyclodiphosphate synthase|nr:2-C-methyl-D-erythritol 2,4-cyclodiphosphate synthase [Planctomycetota bacterium]
MPGDGRVGIGFDIHRLEPADPGGIVLGGVTVPCPYRLIAHSDGDVVLHALCDALLGAVGAGDLGELFPDTDAAHAGRDSCEFVREVLALPALAAFRLVNLDVNIIAQQPRLGPHKPAIRARLQELFELTSDRVGVKARSHEQVDAVGEARAIVCHAAILLAAR